jgi:hypothetical protein
MIMWTLKITLISGKQSIFTKRDANYTGNRFGYDLSIDNSGEVSFNWNQNGSITSSPYKIDTNRWYHIAITHAINGSYKLYIDGVLIKSTSGGSPSANSYRTILGAMDQDNNSLNNPLNYFDGWMDEVRIWNVALSPDQLHQMMNQKIISSPTISGNVQGETIPIDINGLSWANLLGYFQMESVSCGYLNSTTGSIKGKLKNITSPQQQTAPIPYNTKGNGDWNDTSSSTPWTYGNTVWNYPNSTGVNGAPIEWNIVRTGHAVISKIQDITLLGLIVDANQLTITSAGTQDETNAGHGLWITHYLKLDGSIDLVGESQLVQKRYTPSQQNESILDVASSGYLEQDQQGTSNLYNYNYWASPVSIRNTSQNNSPYNINTVLKDGTSSASPLNLKWTNGYNASPTAGGITLSTYWLWVFENYTANTYAKWRYVGQSGAFTVGLGYTMKGSGASSAQQNYVFVGKPNNNTISTPITIGNNALVGNPYPSAIDSELFLTDNGPSGTNSVSGALYFWEHYPVNDTHILRDYQGGYAVRNLTGGIKAATPPATTDGYAIIGGAGNKIPGKYVPVGQGFFVFSSNTGGTVTFKNSQRVFERETNDNSQNGSTFFKSADTKNPKTSTNQVSKEESLIQLIRLEFESPDGAKRPLALGFIPDNKATDGVDYGYDARANEMLPNDMFLMINNERYVIEGVGTFDETKTYPLGIFLTTNGNVKISVTALDNIEEDVEIFIKDNLTGETYKINNQPFEITLELGEYIDRFALAFQPRLKTLDEVKLADGIFTYMNNTISELQINKIVDTEIMSITLFNYLGQTVKTWNSNFAGRHFSLPVKEATGVYIVQINTINGTVNKKIIIE